MKSITIPATLAVLIAVGLGVYSYNNPSHANVDAFGATDIEKAFATAAVTNHDTVATSTLANTTVITGLPPHTLPDGRVLYKNPLLHFSLMHTPGFTINEYNEGSGARTITFEDASSTSEFQIYVTPYTGSQITKERFKLDEPSGVMKEPTDVIVGGAKATMFFSTNSLIGETREVWFIHSGLLYEVTTEKESDSWLAAIMQSWQFI